MPSIGAEVPIDTASIGALASAITLLSIVLTLAGCVWCCRWVSCENNRADDDQIDRSRRPQQGGLLQTWDRAFPDLEDWDELKIGPTLNARRNAEIRVALDQIQLQWSPRVGKISDQAELDMLEVRGIKPRLSVGGEEDFADMMSGMEGGSSSVGHPTLVSLSSAPHFGAATHSAIDPSSSGFSPDVGVTSPVSAASIEEEVPNQSAGEDEWDL
jgi:hypothetical protein